MGDAGNIENIDLPHDAMIYQERTPATANAHQTGFYPGGEYTYMKSGRFRKRGRDVQLFWNLKVLQIPAVFI